MSKKGVKNNIFDIDFLRAFQGKKSHSIFPELVAVLNNLKLVIRTEVSLPKNNFLIKKIFSKNNFFIERSKFLNFGHKFGIPSLRRKCFLYISKSEKLAREAKQIEWELLKGERNYSKFARLSQLMGYPICCSNFFFEFCIKNGNPEHLIEFEIAKKTKGAFSHYLNITRGDCYLISNYPCSYNCRPSIKYARKLLRAIKTINPKYAQKFKSLSGRPVIRFLGPGHYLQFIGAAVKHKKIIIYKSCEGGGEKLAEKFNKGNRLEVEENKIKIFKSASLIDVYHKKNKLDGVIFDFK